MFVLVWAGVDYENFIPPDQVRVGSGKGIGAGIGGADTPDQGGYGYAFSGNRGKIPVVFGRYHCLNHCKVCH